MRIDVISIFPQMFRGAFEESIHKRAREQGLLELNVWDLRAYTDDKHRVVDDYPYGGGRGMVLKPEPLFRAVEALSQGLGMPKERVLLMSPQGKRFHHRIARELANSSHLIIICGRYEGVDERVRQHLITDEISIGDYVLSGGELPAMVVIDTVMRFVPGVIGSKTSVEEETFEKGLLKYPQYTRPRIFRNYKVPDVLLSGNHEKIRQWRHGCSLRTTLIRRPDLLKSFQLTEEDKKLLKEMGKDLKNC